MIINLSYKEEHLLSLSSYPVWWQKLLVAPGVTVSFEPQIQWHYPWLVADEDKVSYVFSYVL